MEIEVKLYYLFEIIHKNIYEVFIEIRICEVIINIKKVIEKDQKVCH